MVSIIGVVAALEQMVNTKTAKKILGYGIDSLFVVKFRCQCKYSSLYHKLKIYESTDVA